MIAISKSAAALAVAAGWVAAALPVAAADLYGGRGSLKDDNMPVLMHAPAGPCYMRVDTGYSFSGTPSVSWPVTDGAGTYLGDKVSHVSTDDAWLVEGGVGCSSYEGAGGGWRGELVLGYRSQHSTQGEPVLWAPPGGTFKDPLHTGLTTYTAMLNAYRDLGSWGNVTPYLGAGIGIAYHMMDNVSFTENPYLLNQIEGSRDIAFAWQLMAGIGYQLSDRAVLDLGYRYVDLGKATSGRADTAGFVNPRVVMDDITAHELKIGLRYSLGSDGAPLK